MIEKPEASAVGKTRDDADQSATAALAFRRFIELTSTPEGLLETPPNEYFDLMEAFLANPRHRPHIEVMVDAVATQRLMRVARPLLGLYEGRVAKLTGVRRWYRRELRKVWERRADRLAERERELAETVSPGTIRLAILPPVLAETRPEWRTNGLQAYEIQADVGVRPAEDLLPDALLLKMNILGDSNAQIIDWSPTNQTVEEADVTSEGELKESASHATKAGAGLDVKGVKLSTERSSAASSEIRGALTVAGKVYRQRVLSDGADREAFWRVRRTTAEAPAGGLRFSVTLLVQDAISSLDILLDAEVEFEEFGKLPAKLTKTVPLPRSA